jgi:hypothetical protein
MRYNSVCPHAYAVKQRAAELRHRALVIAAGIKKGTMPIVSVILMRASKLSTLMSAFASSRQVNPWLCFKRLFQAVAGKAGDAVVITTVDHTLMRGSEPHDRYASRSCLGLGACVGSTIWQIVLARVLLAMVCRLCRPRLPSSFVGFFDGAVQPHLDQMPFGPAPSG